MGEGGEQIRGVLEMGAGLHDDGAMQRAFWGMCIAILAGCIPMEKQCAVPAPSEESLQPVGDLGNGSYKFINGRRLTPAGRQVEVGTFPLNFALSPNGSLLAVTHSGEGDLKLQKSGHQSVWIVDTATMEVRSRIEGEAFFYGIAFSPDGSRLFAATGGGNSVRVYDLSDPARPVETLAIEIPDYPTGVAVTPDGRRLLVTRLHEHTLSVFDTESFEKVMDLTTMAYPYAVVVTPDGSRAFVSNWGDRSVSALDLTAGSTLGRIEVGRTPEGLAVSPDGRRVVVANSDDDSLSVIDAESLEVVATISLKEKTDDPVGVMPVDVTISPDGSRVYAACSGDNMVAVADLESSKMIGKIPTGAYPTAVRSRGSSLYYLNGKGLVARPNEKNEFITGLMWGSVSVLDVPSDAELREFTRRVDENNDPFKRTYPFSADCKAAKGPIPIRTGARSDSIKHVVYVIRENKTYDSLLGDLGGEARGDPNLALFGEEVTPNLHALARRFANLDNCYYESEQSLQGHIWISAGWANDFSERNWPAMWAQKGVGQFYLPGIEPASRGSDTMFYDNLIDHDVSFRVYGDPIGVLSDLFGKFSNHVDFKYPTWALQVRDVDKVKEFKRELDLGIFPSFVSIWVPNDHTRGTSAGAPTPVTMIADNDHATGLIVEAISSSPYWKDTVILIFEDDPQGVPDHVDAHRGPCLVVGPHVKRGHTSHVHYSFPSFHRTMGLILGLPPISRFDAKAAPFLDVFTEDPENIEPYTAVTPNVPVKYNAPDAYGAVESAKMDFSMPDQAPGLGRILWHSVKGRKAPYPAAMAREDDD